MWRNGSKYEGYWMKDMSNDRGRMIYPNGDVYEGGWLND